MAKSSYQKLKPLYLSKILLERSDEDHPIPMQELISALAAYGVAAERKSIYSDLEALSLFGLDIQFRKEQPSGYFIGARDFELPELKLLVDAVQSSKFITYKKSKELIGKISSLTSRYQAQQLSRQVYVNGRIKAMNESIYINVDRLHLAIAGNQQIKFQYTTWNVHKERPLRRNGKWYTVSPWALSWDDENYYLIAYDEAEGIIKHFRVDKMLSISLLETAREGTELFADFDMAVYAKRVFGMFGGEEQTLELRCHNELIGVIIDRFGKDITIAPQSDEYFTAYVKVAVSNQFFGWLAGLGPQASLQAPPQVVADYKKLLQELLKQ